MKSKSGDCRGSAEARIFAAIARFAEAAGSPSLASCAERLEKTLATAEGADLAAKARWLQSNAVAGRTGSENTASCSDVLLLTAYLDSLTVLSAATPDVEAAKDLRDALAAIETEPRGPEKAGRRSRPNEASMNDAATRYIEAFKDPNLSETGFQRLLTDFLSDKALNAALQKRVVQSVTGASDLRVSSKSKRRHVLERWYPMRDREQERMRQLAAAATRC